MSDFERDSSELPVAQRRLLTILFSDLKGYTSLTEQYEPEDVLVVVDHLKRCARRVIAEHCGVVVSYHGDGIMAMFGFPEPSEHDGHRAAAAALALHQAFRTEPVTGGSRAMPALRLHTGIHCEHVVLREDDPFPGHFTLAGQTAPVAQRLSDVARAGEILVSVTTLGGDRHFFEVRDRGLHTLKGKTKPVDVLQVLGLSTARTRFEARAESGLTPFVGRSRELDALDRCLHEVIAGQSREVEVIASPGVGKTRFVEEFLQGIPRGTLRVCRGYCESYLASEPLAPFLHVLRAIAQREGMVGGSAVGRDAASRDAPEPSLRDLQRVASTLFPSIVAPQASGEDAADWFCSLFASMTREAPVVLFLDDWQWADDATKHVLARLRALSLRSLLIVTASRDSLPATERSMSVRVINLKPLNVYETNAVVTGLQADADPFLTEQIYRLSGGNPLFIEELCHWASHETLVDDTDPSQSVPAWLSTLIQSRVARLPRELRHIVHVAAVIGPTIPAWLLERLTGHGAENPALIELEEQDLIYPAADASASFRFKHGITRDVIYLSVGWPERRALHQQIGAILEAEGAHEASLEALSYHFRAALDDDRATRYAELAGDKAMASGAADRARIQYKHALDMLPVSDANYPHWSRIAHRLGLACVFDPSRDHVKDFVRAADLARDHGDDAGLARAEYWLGFLHYAVGDLREAITRYKSARVHCQRAREVATTSADEAGVAEMDALRVQLLATEGQARAAAREHDEALRLLDEALAVKRRHRRSASPAVGSAYALACKGAVLGDSGRFAEAYECFDEALDVIRAGHPAVEASVFGWRSAVLLWQGEWENARESSVRAQRLAERVGSLYVLAMGQAVAAYSSWMLDQAPDALDTIARATSWLEARDKRLSISLAYGWMAEINAAAMRAKETRQCAARALDRARVGDEFGIAMSYRALALLPWRGRGKTPDDYLAAALRPAPARSLRESSPAGSARETAVTLLHQGRHAARSGNVADAVRLLDAARTEFTRMDMQWHDRAAQAALRDLATTRPVPDAPLHTDANRERHLTGD